MAETRKTAQPTEPIGTQKTVYRKFRVGRRAVLERSDCLKFLAKIPDSYVDLSLSSPPYCIGKEYEVIGSIKDFVENQSALLQEIVRVTKPGGSICWQVGHFVRGGVVHPLDYEIFSILNQYKDLNLRNRIIWTFGQGLHCKKRFSGRHETILWFTKGDNYCFNLDDVRVDQKYPGKRHYKGNKKGEFSANPKGKNPSDVWEIPAVNSSHVEKTEHPCQFPGAIAQRLIKGLTNPTNIVLDPFAGSGTTLATAVMCGRNAIGSEIEQRYVDIARKRIKLAMDGKLPLRDHRKPIQQPNPNQSVARVPWPTENL